MLVHKKKLVAQSDYYLIKNVDELILGDIILHPVYREDGLLLISRYTILTTLLISQIKVHLNDDIPVMVVGSEEELKNFFNNNIYSSKSFINDLIDVIEKTNENFKVPITIKFYLDERVNIDLINAQDNEQNKYELFNKTLLLSPLWNSLELALESERLKERTKHIKEIVVNKINSDTELLKIIDEMKKYDDTLFMSCINVLCISMLIGLSIELSDADLSKLCIAALFENVGYLKIDKEEYLKYLKNEEITEPVKIHVKNSIEILSTCPSCRDKDIIYGILDHHEYFNGKGFPAGKRGKQISLIGRILAIATTYEDLVGQYFQNSSMTSNSAINIIWENKEEKFDQQILNVYMYRSNLYKVDQPVFFPGDGRGTVIGFTNYIEAPHRPIVKFINGTIRDYYLI